MKLNFKTGVALTLMSGPVFFVLFLHLFGTNHFQLPRYLCEDNGVCYKVPQELLIGNNDIKVAFLGTETKDNKLSLSRLETVLERKSITGLKYSDNEILSTFIFVSAQREVVNSGFQLLNDTLLQKDLILIDDQSRICGFYTSTDDRAVQQLLNEIGVLIQEQSQK